MSKDMKLIMESWRKLVKENNETLTFETLVEKIQTLDEVDWKKLAIVPVALSAFGMSPDADAAGIKKFGVQDSSKEVVQQAGDIAGDKASGMGKDAEAFQNADKLSDFIFDQPEDVEDSEIVKLAMEYFKWPKSKTYDAYVVLNTAIDAVKNYEAPKKSSQAKPEKAKKAKTMQQRVRKSNQDAFKAGTGGLGPMQE